MLKRCDDKCKKHCKEVCLEINKNIKLTTVTGPQGPTGPTGPTGADGVNAVIARSTRTIDSGLQAKVESERVENITYLDFFIPKGNTGPVEMIRAGKVTSLGNKDQACVVDRFDGKIHYLDFGIPCGNPGEKGDKGDEGPIGPRGFPGETGKGEMISIDVTETLNPGENAQVLDDFENNIHHLTFFIPKGDTGPIGPQGEAGKNGEVGPQGIQGLKGDTGPQGPTGPTDPMKGVFILSYNNNPTTFPVLGQEIASNERLPLIRLELNKEEKIGRAHV